MRLLNIKTMQLEEFSSCYKAPDYAILSHTWGPVSEEITFQDLDNASKNRIDLRSMDFTDAWRRAVKRPSLKDIFANHATKKVGWSKIEGACRFVRENFFESTYQHIWIDTCCIDKSSSSELQEAINSMFSWYQHSKVCLIYLSDVRTEYDPAEEGSSFRKARWFTRGWTLQELIAPRVCCFLNREWEKVGNIYDGPRHRTNLTDLVCNITGISSSYLFDMSKASVAVRMSWAARRKTSREEDIAYCLLGIFGIHMPMLYGEGGTRAFTRLQEEIMKMTDDSSLLAWGFEYPHTDVESFSQVQPIDTGDGGPFLAPHPKYFSDCSLILPRGLRGFRQPSFSIVQRGLMIQLPVVVDKVYEHILYGILACAFREHMVVIPLISSKAIGIQSDASSDWDKDRWESDRSQHEYIRPDYCKPYLVSKEFLKGAKEEQIVIRQTSTAWFKPEFINLPIQIECDSFRVLTMYPLQPTVGPRYLKCLKISPSRYGDSGAHKILIDRQLKDTKGQEVPAERVIHSESGRIILFVETKADRLLITLEYRATYFKENSPSDDSDSRNWIHLFDTPPCQIFKFSSRNYFYLEDLQKLASSWDFSSWIEEKLVNSEDLKRHKYGKRIFNYSLKDSDDALFQIKVLTNWKGESRIVIQNPEA